MIFITWGNNSVYINGTHSMNFSWDTSYRDWELFVQFLYSIYWNCQYLHHRLLYSLWWINVFECGHCCYAIDRGKPKYSAKTFTSAIFPAANQLLWDQTWASTVQSWQLVAWGFCPSFVMDVQIIPWSDYLSPVECTIADYLLLYFCV